jgi:hypothetical protein
MNRGRVGEERGGKETDGCPLTLGVFQGLCGVWIINVPAEDPVMIIHTLGKLWSRSKESLMQ